MKLLSSTKHVSVFNQISSFIHSENICVADMVYQAWCQEGAGNKTMNKRGMDFALMEFKVSILWPLGTLFLQLCICPSVNQIYFLILYKYTPFLLLCLLKISHLCDLYILTTLIKLLGGGDDVCHISFTKNSLSSLLLPI